MAGRRWETVDRERYGLTGAYLLDDEGMTGSTLTDLIAANLAETGTAGDLLKAAKELAETAVVQVAKDAAPSTSPSGAGSDGAATSSDGAATSSDGCCDAYPAAALTAALGTAVDPKELWGALGGDHHDLATDLIKDAAKDRSDLLSKSAWATAAEIILLDRAPKGERENLAKSMLETRAGIDAQAVARHKAEADLAAAQAKVAVNAGLVVVETVAQMRKWRELADSGLAFLKWASIFSALGIAYVLAFLIHGGKVDAAEGPVLIFLLALFAISPAVLLLRERPLEGLDKFSPAGTVGKGEKSGEGEGGSSSSKGSSATTASS